MNIAILIGVSNYKNAIQLPACKLDVENMHRLLSATGKYEEVHKVIDPINTDELKDSIRSFFTKYKSSPPIQEAFVYFSGHGTYQNDALLCGPDFDSERPSSTSISNSELDDLLRSINPQVSVKVIDACNSGFTYIKDANSGFEKSLQKSTLGSFICMASSRQDQSSYANALESYFTSKWIDAAIAKENGTILYRDIEAVLADAFANNQKQTPFFTRQGSGLEIFSNANSALLQLKNDRAKALDPAASKTDLKTSLTQEITKRDREFVSYDNVLSAVEKSKDNISKYVILDDLVKEFYNKTTQTDLTLSAIPNMRAVAIFAEKQDWPKTYFVNIKQESYQVKVLRENNPYVGIVGGVVRFHSDEDSQYRNETRQRPFLLETTERLPLEVASISYSSTHPSLPEFVLYIGLVHSLTSAMVLSTSVRLIQKGWQTRTIESSDVKWRYQSNSWLDIAKNPDILWKNAVHWHETEIRNTLEAIASKNETNSENIAQQEIALPPPPARKIRK